jgi:F-type H+-transporting ATPase subunit b
MIARALSALVLCLSATSAWAAGGGSSVEHHEPHVANWIDPIGRPDAPALALLATTFLVFAIGLVVLLKKPITVYLENRSDTVQKAIEEAKRAREAAEARARDAEQKLAALGDEMKRMRADFEAQGRAETERLEKAAQDAAARIAKDAEDTIAAEAARAQLLLRQEAARLAVELAEEKIRGAVTADDEKRLHKSLVSGLAS